MSIYKIDSSSISSKKSEFKKEKDNFNNRAYNIFKTGYISTCDDSTVKSMQSKLNSLYKTINDGYKEIYNYWDNYINDFDSLEESLKSFSVSCTNPKINGYLSDISDLLPQTPKKATEFVTIENVNYINEKNNNSKSSSIVEDKFNGITKATVAAICPIAKPLLMTEEWKKNAASNLMVLTGVGEGLVTTGQNIICGLLWVGENVNIGAHYLVGDKKNAYEDHDFYSNLTKEIKKENIVHDYYLMSDVANKIKKDSYFDENGIVYQFSESIGEVLGVIGISVATGGSTIALGTSGGLVGAGGTYADAVNDDVNVETAQKAGTVSFFINGLQWFVGGKMNEFAKFSKPIYNSITKVAFDAMDGAVNTPFEAIIQSTYKSGYHDENGDFIKFNEDVSIVDKYKLLFHENGGWQGVAMGATLGILMSSANEIVDFNLGRGAWQQAKGTDLIKTDVDISNADDVIKKIKGNSRYYEMSETELNKILKDLEISKKEVGESIENIDLNPKNWETTYNKMGKYIELDNEIKKVKSALNDKNKKIIKSIKKYKEIDVTKRYVTAFENQNKSFQDFCLYVKKTSEKYNLDYNVRLGEALKAAENGNFSYISREFRNQAIESFNSYKSFRETTANLATYLKGNASNNIFEEFFIENGKYGVDQGINNKFLSYDKGFMVAENEYFRVKEYIKTTYGVNSMSASFIMEYLDQVGACSYAAVANQIIDQYKYNPSKFQSDFGFSMYTTDKLGRKTLNSSQLITDMYLFMNLEENGGSMFKRTHSGKIIINGVYDPNKQTYLSWLGGYNLDQINKYLKSKNNNLNFNRTYIRKVNKNSSPQVINEITNDLIDRISKGDTPYIGSDISKIKFYQLDQNNKIINKRVVAPKRDLAAHAMTITGITSDGFIVSSWGSKYLIPYKQLEGHEFDVQTFNIN